MKPVPPHNIILLLLSLCFKFSAFDMEREREWRQRENALKVQIAQLEATLKADLGEKGNILDRLTAEREATERQDKQNRELQREYYKLKEQHDELKEKMKFFTKVIRCNLCISRLHQKSFVIEDFLLLLIIETWLKKQYLQHFMFI